MYTGVAGTQNVAPTYVIVGRQQTDRPVPHPALAIQECYYGKD